MDELTKDEEVLNSEEILLRYKSGDRPTWVNHFIEDREFYFGEQFDHAVKESYEIKGLLAAAINETLPAVDQIIADLTANSPRFTAMASEDSDTKVANHVAFLFDWIHYISDGDEQVERYTRDFCEGGVGVLYGFPDYDADNGRGELKYINLDPIHVYIDPSSKEPTSKDSANILYSDIKSEDVILSTWDIDLKDAETESTTEYSRQRADTQGQVIFASLPTGVNYYRLIERFTKVKVSRYHVVDPNSNFEKTFEKKEEYQKWREEASVIVVEMNGESYITDDIGVERYLEIYNTIGDTYHLMYDQNGQPQLMPGIEHDSSYVVPNSTTQIKLSTKGEFVDQGIIEFSEPKVPRIQRVFSIGGKLIVNEILPITDYPIVTQMLHHNRTPYASGDIRVIKPLQEQLNILDQRIMNYLRMITTLRVFTPTGSGLKQVIDKKGSPMGMETYETDMENGQTPFIPQYPQLPAGIFQQRENIIRQIQRIIGAYSFQDGEVTNAPRTASGTTQIDEFMRRRAAYKKAKIERGLNQLAKVLAQYVPYVYNQRKMIRLMSPNINIELNKPEKIGDDIKLLNDTTTYSFDVRVISGSMLPTNRAQEREELMRAYELRMLRNPKWWIQKTELENIDEILAEEDMVSQLEGMLQQLQEQVKDLEGQLQTKTREVIQANEKVVVEKTKTALDKLKNKTVANVALTQGRLNDIVKKEKDNGREHPDRASSK